MKRKTLLLTLALYIGSAIISFGAFSYVAGSTNSMNTKTVTENDDETTLLGSLLTIDPNAARDQECPLNGAYYTQAEKDAWSQRRPLAVMIENHPDARPQSGLSDADVVFEAVAEGGVTRFMGMFYCDVQRYDTTLAPIRSARTYFVDWASGFNEPMYVHVGGANLPGPADALGQISEYGWNGENDINQFSVGYPTFVRDYNRLEGKEVATEHTMVTSTEKLWEVAQDRGWTNVSPERRMGRTTVGGDDWLAGFEPWTFADETTTDGSITTIGYDFWSGYNEYSIRWEYDEQSNSYKRFMANEPHTDLNNEDQIMARNVIVLLTSEKGPIDEKKHMLYGTIGTGDALIFKDGEVIEATWSKPSRTAELRFLDSRGDDVPLARGLTWISVVNTVTEVQY